MTLIEFFQKDAIENICSSLLLAPDRVILLGDKLKLMKRHAENYKTVLDARGVCPEFICRVVNKNKLQTVTDILSAFIEDYGDCVFDLTGGDDLLLVAVGVVFEKYKERGIQMHRFNIKNNTIIDVDQDGKPVLDGRVPTLSVEENISVYGGAVIFDAERKNTTFRWDMNGEFKDDINAIWDICRRNVRQWNVQIAVFKAAYELAGSPDELTLSVPVGALQSAVESDGGKYAVIDRIIRGLCSAGLLTSFSDDGDIFSLGFKNSQVRRCLTLGGRALEMKVFLAAVNARFNDGSRAYDDVMNGVFIDWDGDTSQCNHGVDTENEIDVIMIHGMVPVFVSCKNGHIEAQELYKLNTVAERFGGKYAKKVLVATALDSMSDAEHIRQRAADMGIRVVEGFSNNGNYRKFTEMTDREIDRVIRSLWSN